MTPPKITVDFSASANKLLVRCPVWANDLVRELPSYRWSKKERAWLVPMTRKNTEMLRTGKLHPYSEFTPAANEAMRKLDTAVAVSKGPAGFPQWYPFKTQPRKHQTAAIAKGYPLKALALFMDMQTGKTKTVIDLVAAHRMEGHVDAMLVLVKLSLRNNWLRQLNLHCPIPFDFHAPRMEKERAFRKWLETPHDFKVMVIGWESLSAGRMIELCKDFMRTRPRVAVVGDETTYIAGHKAERALRSVDLSAQAEYKYALTGTPIMEGPMNLFMQFEFLDPNVIGIGDYYAFRNRYAIMGGYRDPRTKRPMQIVGYQNMDELVQTVAPHVFQVTKKEAYDLPPKRYEERTVQLTKAQRDLYTQAKRNESFFLGKKHDNVEVVLKNVLEVALRLHQITGGYAVKPRDVTRMGRDGEIKKRTVYDPVELVKPKENPKVVEIMDTIEEMGKHKQGLIWCVYLPEIGAVRWALQHMGLKWGELHGQIVENDRQPNVDRFERGEYQFILGNASTGGMGYTMMASQVNMFYNNTFKMIDRTQAEDRAYGDGQTKSGVWIDYTAEDTIDKTILKALEMKMDLAAFIRQRIADATLLLDGQV